MCKFRWNVEICDPPILVRERDIDGAIIEGGYDNMWVVEAMKKSGWEHRGFNTGYDVAAYARFMFTLPLTGMTEEQVYKQFHSQNGFYFSAIRASAYQISLLLPYPLSESAALKKTRRPAGP